MLHHIIYITNKNYQDDNIFYNTDNVEALCQDCHNKEHFADKEEYIFNEDGDLIQNNQPPYKHKNKRLWENGGWGFEKYTSCFA